MSRRINTVIAAAVLVVAFSSLIPVSSVAEFSTTTDMGVHITFDIPDETPPTEDVIVPETTDVIPAPDPESEPEPVPEQPSDNTVEVTPPTVDVATPPVIVPDVVPVQPDPQPEPEVVDPVVPTPEAQAAPTLPEPEGLTHEEISQ